MQNNHYQSLYRKYRPETFEEVMGQEEAVSFLKSSIEKEKVTHAYLFSGGRGTGKTTVARIFAKELGTDAIDIIEIDAASNRGIDEIRELREAVRTSPFSSRYKVYIIDEAHMLTKDASNALLKTLEEPGEHIIFILATTDPEKLPDTILSRCQRVNFKEPSIETLTKTLISIAKKEGFKLGEEEGEEIAKHGKGSFRDALVHLEKVLNVSEKNVEMKTLSDHLGTVEEEFIIKIIKSVCEKDKESLSKLLNNISSKKLEAINLYDKILEITRRAIYSRITKEEDRNNLVTSLGKDYPSVVDSKTLLRLLNERTLVERSGAQGFTAIFAILINISE